MTRTTALLTVALILAVAAANWAFFALLAAGHGRWAVTLSPIMALALFGAWVALDER